MAPSVPEKEIYDPFRSERLLYRAIEDNEKDEEFFLKLCTDPQVMFMAAPIPSKPLGKTAVKELRKEFEKETLLVVFICKRPESADKEAEPIGMVALKDSKMVYNRNSELGVMLVQEHQGKGYGPEAISWILDYGFTTLGLHRIDLVTYEMNERAQKAYIGMGWVVEGRKRQALWKAGHFWDIIIMGILAEEWKEKKRAAT